MTEALKRGFPVRLPAAPSELLLGCCFEGPLITHMRNLGLIPPPVA